LKVPITSSEIAEVAAGGGAWLGTAEAEDQRQKWLATCSHSPRREECYLYATGFTHALYIWHELAPLTARVCLPETWDNEQAVVATNALLRQYPAAGVMR
jgi:hypothetical protein